MLLRFLVTVLQNDQFMNSDQDNEKHERDNALTWTDEAVRMRWPCNFNAKFHINNSRQLERMKTYLASAMAVIEYRDIE